MSLKFVIGIFSDFFTYIKNNCKEVNKNKKMKSNYLAKIACAGVMAITPMLTGCQNNTELEIGMRIKQKHVVTANKENYKASLEKVYDVNDSLHNKTTVSQKTVDAFMEAYNNRQ